LSNTLFYHSVKDEVALYVCTVATDLCEVL